MSSKCWVAALVLLVVAIVLTLYTSSTFRGGGKEGFESGAVFTFWKMNGCPHCVKFEDTYASLKAEFEGRGVEFKSVDDMSVARTNGVTAFPTLELSVGGGSPQRYSGPRTHAAISEWIRQHTAA